MGYLFNSFMRDVERNRNKRQKAVAKQRADKNTAVTLTRLIGGIRCPRCGQEAHAAKFVPAVPANAGVRLRGTAPAATPAIACTCPSGHKYQVRDGRLLPPQPGRRVR